MRTFTAKYLIDRARQRADQEDVGFIGEQEALDMLNEEYRDYLYLAAELGWRPEMLDFDITANGAVYYELPDYMNIIWVAEVEGDSLYTLDNINAHSSAAFETDDYYEARAYLLEGNKLRLMGQPTTGTYRVRYVPEPDIILSETDQVRLLPGGERWITARMAINMRIKEEASFQDLLTVLEASEERLRVGITKQIANGIRRSSWPASLDFYEPMGMIGPWPRRGRGGS